MKKKIFTLFLALVASAGMLKAEVYNGTCGENLTWELNTETGTLTIEGSGEMRWYQNNTPWRPYRSYIKNVSLPESLTRIECFAFYGCTGLTSVTIPNSVTYVDWEGMFEGCTNLTSLTIGKGLENIITGVDVFGGCENLANIEVVSGNPRYDSRNNCNAVIETSSNALVLGGIKTTIPSTITSIKEGAFASRNCLRSIVIPSSVTTIEEYAFYGCSGLLSITNYATTPQNITEDVFSGTDEYPGVAKLHCKLYVPENSIPMYKVAIGWRDFAYIEAIEVSEDIENTSIEPKTSKIIRDGQVIIERNDKTYTLQGQEVR